MYFWGNLIFMSVAEMKQEVIQYIQKVDDEKLIEDIVKRIRAYENKFDNNLTAKDIFAKAQLRYDDVLQKLAQ